MQDVGGKSFFLDRELDLEYQIYLLFNGLSVDEDPVVGDYTAWITSGDEGAPYSITALLGGEVLWIEEGVLDSERRSPEYVATLTEYADSDCSIEAYGKRSLRIETRNRIQRHVMLTFQVTYCCCYCSLQRWRSAIVFD